MLGGNQDLFAKVTAREEEDEVRSGETLNVTLCPACMRPMTHVRTIWRAYQVDLRVFECPACIVSVSAKVPPQSKP